MSYILKESLQTGSDGALREFGMCYVLKESLQKGSDGG